MNRHSEIFIPPETAFFFRLKISGFSEKIFSQGNAKQFIHYYSSSRPAELLRITDAENWTNLLEHAERYSDIFDGLLKLLARRSHKTIIGEKTPHHLTCIDLILSYYPRAPIVALVRDGRAVVRSRVNHPNWSNSLLTAAWHWRDDAIRLRRLLDSSTRDQVIVVKYEDLILQPAEALARVCNHLGVSFEAEMLEKSDEQNSEFAEYYQQKWMSKSSRDIDTSRISSWKSEFSRGELRLIENQIGEELENFGYQRAECASILIPLFWVQQMRKHLQFKISEKLYGKR